MPKTGATATPAEPGLAGIIAAETTLSRIDGDKGRMIYRGYTIDDLVMQAFFEEVLYLLILESLPDPSELTTFNERLSAHRPISPAVLRALRALPTSGAPIDALRAGVTAGGMEDSTARSLDHDALIEKSIMLAAALPGMLAAFDRLRRGLTVVDPDPELSHAANFLYMLHGTPPNDLHTSAFNSYLVLLAEHGMNASTFSARATISTLSDLYAAISTALGTLKGDAHGGANQRVMEMLLEIGTVERVPAFVDESLRSKRRLMGIGHRIYKTRDPRVNHLMRYSELLTDESGNNTWHQIAVRLEEITNDHPYFRERKLFPNVEFYSAPLLYMLGLEPDLMPAALAISRIAGWSGHVMEQISKNRIIRPLACYIGPAPRPYTALSERR